MNLFYQKNSMLRIWSMKIFKKQTPKAVLKRLGFKLSPIEHKLFF